MAVKLERHVKERDHLAYIHADYWVISEWALKNMVWGVDWIQLT